MYGDPQTTYKIVRITEHPDIFVSDGVLPRPPFEDIDGLVLSDPSLKEHMKENYGDVIGPLAYMLGKVTWKAPGSDGIYTYDDLGFAFVRLFASKATLPIRRLLKCEGYRRLPIPKRISVRPYVVLNHPTMDWPKEWYQDAIYAAIKPVEIIYPVPE